MHYHKAEQLMEQGHWPEHNAFMVMFSILFLITSKTRRTKAAHQTLSVCLSIGRAKGHKRSSIKILNRQGLQQQAFDV